MCLEHFELAKLHNSTERNAIYLSIYQVRSSSLGGIFTHDAVAICFRNLSCQNKPEHLQNVQGMTKESQYYENLADENQDSQYQKGPN